MKPKKSALALGLVALLLLSGCGGAPDAEASLGKHAPAAPKASEHPKGSGHPVTRFAASDPTDPPQVGSEPPAPAMEQGVVIRYDEAKRIGYIDRDQGPAIIYTAHSVELEGGTLPAQGDRVEFLVVENSDGGPLVVRLRTIN